MIPPASEDPFETLLAAARAGDGIALGRLLERASPRLAKAAAIAIAGRTQLRGREADLVQETLKDAIMGFDQFLGKSHAGWHQWLKRILENNLTDMCRYEGAAKRDTVKEQRLDTDFQRNLPDGDDTPSRAFVRSEDLQQLEKALASLSEIDQTIIRLRDTEQRPFSEIAQILSKTTAEAVASNTNGPRID